MGVENLTVSSAKALHAFNHLAPLKVPRIYAFIICILYNIYNYYIYLKYEYYVLKLKKWVFGYEYSSVVQSNMHEAMKLIHNITSKNIFWSKSKAAFKGKFIVLNIFFVRGMGKAHDNSSPHFKKLEKRDNHF